MGPAGEDPRGPSIAVHATLTGRVEEGTLRESEFAWDMATLRRQLGAGAGHPQRAADSAVTPEHGQVDCPGIAPM